MAASSGHALERIANRPIVEHVLEALELAGVDEVLVASSSAHSNGIRNCLSAREKPDGPSIRYLHREAPLEVTDALRMAAPVVGDAPCIVHLGTGLLDEPLAAVRRPGCGTRRTSRCSCIRRRGTMSI